MATISQLEADWILDSRGIPTVEARITLSDGRYTVAHAPSGASTGSHECHELRDADSGRFRGRGVSRACAAVRGEISAELAGLDVTDLEVVDETLVALDGTPDRSRLGTNALVAVSAACAKAGAMTRGVPLWQHLAGTRRASLPLPMVNIVSGGVHARGGMSVQDVMVVPHGAPDITTAIQWVVDVYHAAGALLESRNVAPLVGDEGGYGAVGISSEVAIDLVSRSIETAGHHAGKEISLALDVAATQLLDRNGCYLLDGATLSADDLVGTLVDWTERYPIVAIEDPLSEDDWADWTRMYTMLDPQVQLVGDDLICTRLSRLERAATEHCANTVLVKANQIGTLSEALAVVDRANELQLRAIVSARSGETEDDWLADLAVASGAGQIKVGSVARSERLVKYNRLLRIARSPGCPPWAGYNDIADSPVRDEAGC